MTATVIYLGNLRTTMRHLSSGQDLVTDAPVDNHGMGEAFSPTDLCATSLAACQLTTMGIYAQHKGLDITGAIAGVTKVMGSNPRRIIGIQVEIEIPEKGFSDQEKEALVNAARHCPVSKSLHPDISQELKIGWKQD